jgi:amino acid transporter
LKRVLIGKPISSEHAEHQRISKTIGLAVFSSDAISSTAYATGEILIVLVGVGGMQAMHLLRPIAFLVVALLFLVVNSYRETIHAYPDGGGAYVVSRENLGELPSLIAGASLLTDYVLTVAVSIAAGVLAIYSVYPSLEQYRVEICLGFVAILTIGNLRGLKESGRVFAVPTYIYITALVCFIGFALYKRARGELDVIPVDHGHLKQVIEDHGPLVGSISTYIFARAFASGAVALSGVEAISNGIPAFRRPTSKNAATTLVWMGVILGGSFFAINYIGSWMRPTPSETESALSIMGRALFGGSNPLYYVLQFSTMAILVLAANTAYADFPRLAAIVGGDGYLPRQFAARGDRLVFSNGILILAGAASVLLIVFNGDVTALIPLYAVGVFTSFTLSQFGMVRHHLHERQPRWQLSVLNSALGAAATFVVTLVVVVSKFKIGAWVIVLLIPLIVVMFKGVKRHYDGVGRQLRVDPAPEAPPLRHGVVVLVGSVNRSALMALRYARSLHADDIVAISVAIDDDHTEALLKQWDEFGISVPLEILDSPYRDLTHIVLDYLDELERRWGFDYIAVVIPEAVVPHWWQGIFHNQSALALKLRLLNRRDTIVINVPYHLAHDPEEEALVGRRRSGATLPEATSAPPGEPYATAGNGRAADPGHEPEPVASEARPPAPTAGE